MRIPLGSTQGFRPDVGYPIALFGGYMRQLMLVGALAALVLATPPQRLSAQSSGMIGPSSAALRATAALRPQPPTSFTVSQPHIVAEFEGARASRRQGEILMIVGGAVLVTGLIVDESLITIVGVAVGGYGLYLYLREKR
jgi:hypothetical protein